MALGGKLVKFYDNILSINKIPIIVIFDKSNTIWFSYNDILQSIGYANVKLQKHRLNLDSKYFLKYSEIDKLLADTNETLMPIQPNLKMINESGLLVLLNRSNKSLAKDLTEELLSDVLPTLRKKGKYVLNSIEKKYMESITKKIQLYQQELKRTKKKSYSNKTGKGFIYVLEVKTIQNGANKNCYKVGYTANLEKRLATYRTGNPDIELAHQENVNCNKKQLETCIINLNILKRLKNKTEVICDVPLEKIKKEIEDCKKLLEKYSSKSDTG
jgi:prophage antirepressor-like protein